MPCSLQLLKVGSATRLHQHSSKKPTAQVPGLASATPIRRSRRLFSLVQGVGGGDPPLRPHPSNSEQPRQSRPDGFPGDPPSYESLLESDFGGYLQSPQARVVSELPRPAVEQLSESLGAPFVESGMDALGARGSRREGEKPALVEGVDGVPDRLRAASQTPGDLRRGLSARACQKYLASAHHEGIFGAQPRLEALALLSRKRTYKDGRLHGDHYSSSHTTLSEDALVGAGRDERVGDAQTQTRRRTPSRAEERSTTKVERGTGLPRGPADTSGRDKHPGGGRTFSPYRGDLASFSIKS